MKVSPSSLSLSSLSSGALSALLVAVLGSGCMSPVDKRADDRSDPAVATSAGLEAIEFYQDHLGSQWGFHCDFHPSCSRFGHEAFSDYGFLQGTMMTADRLMRDHPYSRNSYARTRRGHPFDPPSQHALVAFTPPDWKALGEEDLTGPVGGVGSKAATEQLSFANQLFSESDWDRARIEYRRYAFLFPNGEDLREAKEREAICLARLGHHAEAMAVVESHPDDSRRSDFLALILRIEGRVREARALIADDTSNDASLIRGFLSLEEGNSEAARREFEALPESARAELLQRCLEYDDLPSKSRVAAGVLSALLPGSGQVYVGRYADGLVAFLFNGLLIGGTVAAATNDEEVTAIALGTVAFGFYAGNVYGGINAAHRFNVNTRRRFVSRAKGSVRQNWAKLGLGATPSGGVISFYFDF